MNKLSTGADSTLGNWIDLCLVSFGKESKATKFLEAKMKNSPNGKEEEVLADESQLLYALMQIHLKGCDQN